jgi:hypothetical protein
MIFISLAFIIRILWSKKGTQSHMLYIGKTYSCYDWEEFEVKGNGKTRPNESSILPRREVLTGKRLVRTGGRIRYRRKEVRETCDWKEAAVMLCHIRRPNSWVDFRGIGLDKCPL